MKKTELTVGMTVESQIGTRLRVVATTGWLNPFGGSPKPTGLTVDGHPVMTHAVRGTEGRHAPGVLVVGEGLLDRTAPGGAVIAEVMQSRFLYPEGSSEYRNSEAQVAYERERLETLAADAGLLAKVRSLWGIYADPLLEDTQVRPEEGFMLTQRDRDTLQTIIICGQSPLLRQVHVDGKVVPEWTGEAVTLYHQTTTNTTN